MQDGTRVCIKKVTDKQELGILQYLCDPERRDHPRNRTVPLLDHFKSTDDDIILLVLPYLCAFDVPPFSFVDEALDFIQQTLEVCNTLLNHCGINVPMYSQDLRLYS